MLIAACGLILGLLRAAESSAGDDPASAATVAQCQVPPLIADFYPEGARARGIEGRALVEFGLTARGTTTDARIVAEEPEGNPFGQSALAATKILRCEIPAAWKGQDLTALRLRGSYLYRLIPCRNPDDCRNPVAYPNASFPPVVFMGGAIGPAWTTRCSTMQCRIRVEVPFFRDDDVQTGGVQVSYDLASGTPSSIEIQVPPDASPGVGVAIRFGSERTLDPAPVPLGDPVTLPVLRCNEETCTAGVPESLVKGEGKQPGVFQRLQLYGTLWIAYSHGGKNDRFDLSISGLKDALKQLPPAAPSAPGRDHD